MLLTAILLIIGFVALTGLVQRVNQAGSTTAHVQDDPILLEVNQLSKAVDAAIEAHKANATEWGVAEDSAAFRDALAASLDHLVLIERARGFRMEHTFVQEVPLLTGQVEVTLQDSRTRLTFQSDTFSCSSC